jgi:hypothetical protein
MPAATHRTVKLSRGSHQSPDHGACVMELASMLAGERFGDHPRSVCPVIGAYLRTYNDRIDDDRRQDLYAYAARVVGSRSTRTTERERAELCLAWRYELTARRPFADGGWRLGRSRRLWVAHEAALAAARSTMPDAHPRALAFIDRMFDVGRRRTFGGRNGRAGHDESARPLEAT